MTEEYEHVVEKITALEHRVTLVEQDVRQLHTAWKLPWWWWCIMIIAIMAVLIFILSDTSDEVSTFLTDTFQIISGGEDAESTP